MEAIEYIDWDEGREFEDASFSVAVNICEGCNHTCERLTVEPVEGLHFCNECMEETMREIEREAKRNPQQGGLFREKEAA